MEFNEEFINKLEAIAKEKLLNKTIKVVTRWGGNPEDEWFEEDEFIIDEIEIDDQNDTLDIDIKRNGSKPITGRIHAPFKEIGIDPKKAEEGFNQLSVEKIKEMLDHHEVDDEYYIAFNVPVEDSYSTFVVNPEVKSFLEKYLVKADDPKNKLGKTYVRGLTGKEVLPRGVYHKAKTDTSGIIHFNGKDYYWYLDNNDNINVRLHIHDSLDKRFVAQSYFDEKLRGLEDKLETNRLDEAKDWVWMKSQKGFVTRIIDTETGEVWVFDEINVPEELDEIEEVDLSSDQIQIWDVVWYDEKGYRHSIEFDNQETAEEFVAEHPDYKEIKILEGIKNLGDSMEEVEVTLENMPDGLIEKAYKEYCTCAKKEKFEISSELIKLLNEISKYTKTTETEIMQMFKEMFEKEILAVQDSKTLRPIDGEELKRKLRKVLKDYLLSEGFEEDDCDRWIVIDVEDFTNEDGDSGVHVQIRNDLVGYYDLPDLVLKKLDAIVKPGYFEPYYDTVWDAYIWDRRLGKSSLEDEDVEDEEDSNKIIRVLNECKEILRRTLVEEGFEGEGDEIFSNAGIEVTHKNDNGKDIIILKGEPSWMDTSLEEDIINDIGEKIFQEYGAYSFNWSNNSAGGSFKIGEDKHIDDSVYSYFVSKIRNARSMVELEKVQDLLLKYEENGLVGPNTADELWHEVDLRIDELKK